MKKLFHNIIAIALYLAIAGSLSLAFMPLVGTFFRSVMEPLGWWDSIWFLLPFVLALAAVTGAWTYLVCRTYIKATEKLAKRQGFGWVAVQSW